MKRKIALLLSFIFIFCMVIPAQGFAADMDKSLENAIKIAKTKFSIPESFKFESNISIEGTKKIFYLSWRNNDSSDPSSINVRIDENGTIVGYNKYSRSDYIQTRKLPKFSRQEAKVKADEYIKGIDPELLENIRYQESNQTSIMETSYYLSYYRVVNEVPFYNDRVTVTINRETGALQDYSRQWTDNLTFPAVTKPIMLKEAEEAYTKNLGLRLIYKYTNLDNVLKAYPVYVPIYDNGNYGINAFTGERQRLFGNYYYGGYADGMMNTSSQKSMRAVATEEVQLNPDELKAVQDASKLISQEEAEKIARSSKFLNISADSKLQSYHLGTNWPDRDEYMWSLQFNKPSDDTTRYNEYTSVTINANTAVITSFYRGAPYIEGAKPKNDMTVAKAAVDEFLLENYPKYYEQLEYDKLSSENNSNDNGSTKNMNYSFVYSRLVDGVAFPDNGVNINYDNVSGMIIGFNLNWYNISFPSVENVIGIAAASDKLYESVGLGLEYKYEYVSFNELDAKLMGNPAVNAKVLLVYSFNPNKPLAVDANTGKLLTYDGTEFKVPVKVNYTDIKGNYAEKQIMVLAENGVYLEDTEFKPNTNINQKDFLTLLSKTLNYYGPIITSQSTTKDIDDLYAYLQREGIVKAGEKAPTNTVTREEALKFIIRALKYDKVADIKGIYSISFKDKASIDPNLTGYIAIAAGLGIVNSKTANFRPKANLTRSECAIMIYNYLQS